MTIMQLMEMFNMTIHELIEMIKMQGQLIECKGTIFSLPNDRYGERAVILFQDNYFVTYAILDNFLDVCYLEDIQIFVFEYQAITAYNDLLEQHNAQVYE